MFSTSSLDTSTAISTRSIASTSKNLSTKVPVSITSIRRSICSPRQIPLRDWNSMNLTEMIEAIREVRDFHNLAIACQRKRDNLTLKKIAQGNAECSLTQNELNRGKARLQQLIPAIERAIHAVNNQFVVTGDITLNNAIRIRDAMVPVLMQAAEVGNENVVQSFIDIGQVNIRNSDGKTALMIAVMNRCRAVVQRLIDGHVDLEAHDNMGNTALMYATPVSMYLVQQLLSAGARLDARDKRGQNALMIATHLGCSNALQTLINAHITQNVSLDLKNDQGYTALSMAGIDGYCALMQKLIDAHADVDIIDNEGNTLLMLSAYCDQTGCVQMLLSKGARLDARDKLGNNALMKAAYRDYSNALQPLINAHADQHVSLDLKNNKGYTALSIAGVFNHSDMIHQLIDAKADVEAIDNDGKTPLMQLSSLDKEEGVRILLSAGARLDARDHHGHNALMIAACLGRSNVMQILINAHVTQRVSLDLKNKNGETALMLAQQRNHTVGVEMLTKAAQECSYSMPNARKSLTVEESTL